MEKEMYELCVDLVKKELKNVIDDQKNKIPEVKLEAMSAKELKIATWNNILISILSPKDKILSEEEKRMLGFLHDHFGEIYDKVYNGLYLELTDTSSRFMNASEYLMGLIRGGINHTSDDSRSVEEQTRQREQCEEDKQEIKPGMKRGLTRRTLSGKVQAFNKAFDDEQSRDEEDKQEIKSGMKRGLTRRTLSDTVQAFNKIFDDEQSKEETDKDLPTQGKSEDNGERI